MLSQRVKWQLSRIILRALFFRFVLLCTFSMSCYLESFARSDLITCVSLIESDDYLSQNNLFTSFAQHMCLNHCGTHRESCIRKRFNPQLLFWCHQSCSWWCFERSTPCRLLPPSFTCGQVFAVAIVVPTAEQFFLMTNQTMVPWHALGTTLPNLDSRTDLILCASGVEQPT